MNFDDILPFIIFVAYIGFVLFKKVLGKKKEPRKDKPAKKAFFGFSKLINTIKSELAKVVNEAKLKEKQVGISPRKNIWEELREDRQEDKLAGKNFENEETAQAQNITETSTKPVDEPQIVEPQIQTYHANKSQPFAIKKRKQKKVWHLSVSKLKEAVVLSEILAKPVGLREEIEQNNFSDL